MVLSGCWSWHQRHSLFLPCDRLRSVASSQVSNVFAGKHGFITPRDLFKWAGRGAVGYEQLAENGYLLLGERLRTVEDRAVVRQVLERQMRVQVGFTHSSLLPSATFCVRFGCLCLCPCQVMENHRNSRSTDRLLPWISVIIWGCAANKLVAACHFSPAPNMRGMLGSIGGVLGSWREHLSV